MKDACILFVFVCSLTVIQYGVSSKKHDVTFDYFVFAQQWPESACLEAKNTGRHKCLIEKVVTTWTVHGLWPSKINDSTGPFNCNSSEKFDINAVKDLLPLLEEYWPNLFTDEKNISFWSHEWVKHGTCAQAGQAVPDQHGYFKLALDIHHKLDIIGNLKKLGIVPVDNYSYVYSTFVKTLRDIVGGKNVRIECYHEKHQLAQFVKQLEICLDKQSRPIDCAPDPAADCKTDKPIAFPTIKHPF